MKIVLCSLAIAACTPPAPPPGAAGPVEAVQGFADALQKGDAQAAWSLLSKRSQDDAERLGKAAGKDGRAMLFDSALPGAPLGALSVQEHGDSADVFSAPDGGKARTFHTVREGALWRVDLDLSR